jgi:predicted Zn-dependent protease with MMP-like domain
MASTTGDEGMKRRTVGMIWRMVSMSFDAFESLVAGALEQIPSSLREAMENVAVIVDDASPPGRLLGLYEGVPLTKRSGYSAAMPDRITIYMATICAACQTTADVVALVRKTVIHEVAHHFGISDPRLDELGWA